LKKNQKSKWKKVPKGSVPLGFWQQLAANKKPFFVLAPMADVTDRVFRKIIAKYSRFGQEGGGPAVFWTEFVSADGVMSEGRDALIVNLAINEGEHPIVAQIFGTNLEKLEACANMCVEMGFDGIDINFGCPEKNIVKSGGGCGAIQNPEHAVRVVQAVQRGAAGRVPVSVKTRLGFNKEEIETWVPTLLQTGPAVLTMHFRTRKEMSKVPARWDRMLRIRELRDQISPDTVLIGNGDVLTLEQGREWANKYGAEGVMIGRGIFGNPWFFANSTCTKCMGRIERPAPKATQIKNVDEARGNFENAQEWVNSPERSESCASKMIPCACGAGYVPTLRHRLEVMLEHTKLYTELLPMKNFNIMKKHYKAYVNGFDGAKELRTKLMECKTYEEIEVLTKDFINQLS